MITTTFKEYLRSRASEYINEKDIITIPVEELNTIARNYFLNITLMKPLIKNAVIYDTEKKHFKF